MDHLSLPQFPLLTQYTDDITLQIALGQLSPSINEADKVYVERVLQILHRRTRNDPILVGEDHARKLAIVHEVTRRIIQKELPDNRMTHIERICAFRHDAFFADDANFDMLRNRLAALLKEIEPSLRAPTIVLFVDDLHNLIGTQNEKTQNIGRTFVTAHVRGEIQFIGATTLGNYQQYLDTNTLYPFDRHSVVISIE